MLAKETGMIELSEQQLKALTQRQEFPPRVVNPRTKEVFVLIHEEMFERVRNLLEQEDELGAVEEMLPLAAEALDAEDRDMSAKESA
jgi:hypothetical protein